MRKYIIFVLFLCTYHVARGQTSIDFDYWFDNDRTTLRQASSADSTWHFAADLEGLSNSLHLLHMQVRDAEGLTSSPVTRYFLKVAPASGQRIRFWFDTDSASAQTADALNGMHLIDLSSLRGGLHSFHCQAIDAEGNGSNVISKFFLKDVSGGSLQNFHCWFDGDGSTMQSGFAVGSMAEIDVSGLSDGLHLIHIQADGETPTAVHTYYFLKQPQTQGTEHMTLVCSIDNKPYKQQRVTNTGGAIVWDIDTDSLQQGLHSIQIEAVTQSGAASASYNNFFLRSPMQREIEAMKLYYFVDNKEAGISESPYNGKGFHFNADVSHLTDGLHCLAYYLSDGSGTTTRINSQYFWKIPLGGNGIMRYDYWLNENDEDKMSATFAERKEDISLISLLPVPSYPIRSSCFHFELTSGKPTIYAKNDFHLRFYDASYRFTDVQKQFVDYSVSEPIEKFTPLTSGQREWKNVPQENKIHWFTAQATRGDSLSVKTTQAATIQIFSPTGQEVYSASGSSSINYGGCHAQEDGTFYIALHDVTGTSSSTIGLDYEHIDRYAILRQDVNVVGNEGTCTITFEGNGFNELQTVELRLAGNVICADSIGHEHNAATSVLFNFSNAPLGQYSALFRFAEGEVSVQKCITVEEATPFEFETSASFAKQYLRTTANKYTFKIQNKSNVMAYGVPLAIHIYSKDSTNVKRVMIEGFEAKKHIKSMLGERYTDSIDTRISLQENSSGDLWYFLKDDNTDNVTNYPFQHHAFITSDLLPGNSKTINVSVQTNEEVYVYLLCPRGWSSEIAKANAKRIRKATVFNDAACAMEMNRQRMCEENQRMEEYGMSPIYNVDCDDIPLSSSKCPDSSGGGSTPVSSLDPNDIYGYRTESGSTFMKEELLDLNYTIEFENDPEFATASAHTVVVTDTLDKELFDLTSFVPTQLKIGERRVELDGTPNFVKTIDVRPEINAIAQVEGSYDKTKGIARWTFTSLDPMTMEPTDNVMSGFLPINDDRGSGIGEVSFNISLKRAEPDGTSIPNKACIVFDANDPIMTPVWTNVVDAVAPTSHIAGGVMKNDSIVTLHLQGSDERSGVWRYDVYQQLNSDGAWNKIVEHVSDTLIDVRYYDGIDQGFYVCATDSAGNLEQKEPVREWTLNKVYVGDANGDGKINSEDVLLAVSRYLGRAVFLNTDAADVNRDGKINSEDVVAIVRLYLEEQVRRNVPIKKPIRRKQLQRQ